VYARLQVLPIALAAALWGSPVEAVAAPTEQIVARMMELDGLLTPRLRDYTSVRRYVLENKRFGQRAEMTVRLKFRYPGHKEFEVISEQGSGTIRKRVLRKMLDSEIEASRDELRDATQITPRNYTFRLVGSEELAGRKSFVLEVTPKTKNKYLFLGKVWVDAEDYGIARIEGTPAQNPSAWVRKTSFVHRYEKMGPFWLAVSTTSSTDVWVFGRTDLHIDYSSYRINEHSGGQPAEPKVSE
jgi:outer membrane lipoprotein-sorting protein